MYMGDDVLAKKLKSQDSNTILFARNSTAVFG